MLRRLVTLFLICLVTFGLVNCTSSAPVKEKALRKDPTFTIWWSEGYFPEETAAIRKIATTFEKEINKDVKDPRDYRRVALTIFSERGLSQAINIAIDNNTVPDILYSYGADFNLFPRLAWLGNLHDVSDVLAVIKDDAQKPEKERKYGYQFTAQALKSVEYQNDFLKKKGSYAIPLSLNTISIHYWQDLLAEAGLENQPIPNNWDAFWDYWIAAQQVIRQRQQKRSGLFGLGLPMSPAAADTFLIVEQFLDAYDVEIMDSQGNLKLNDPKVKQGILHALTKYTSMYAKGGVPPNAKEWGDPGNNGSFLSRESLMTINPTLSIPASQSFDDETYTKAMASIPWPNRPDGKPLTSLVSVKQVGLFEASPNKELAKRFLKYLLLPENLTEIVKGAQGRYFPVTSNLISDPFFTNPKDPHISVVAQQVKTSRPLGQLLNPAYSEVQAQNVWGKAVNSIVSNKKTPQEATEQAIAEIKTIFSNWSKV